MEAAPSGREAVAVVGMGDVGQAAAGAVLAEQLNERRVEPADPAVLVEHAHRVGRQAEQSVAFGLGAQTPPGVAPEQRQAQAAAQGQPHHREHQAALEQPRAGIEDVGPQAHAAAGGVERQLVAEVGLVDVPG